jgi:hypothetical protein
LIFAAITVRAIVTIGTYLAKEKGSFNAMKKEILFQKPDILWLV